MTFAQLGQYGDALTWQREAMAAADRAGRPELAAPMAETLSRYQRHQPCRTPWRRDDPPGNLPTP